MVLLKMFGLEEEIFWSSTPEGGPPKTRGTWTGARRCFPWHGYLVSALRITCIEAGRGGVTWIVVFPGQEKLRM